MGKRELKAGAVNQASIRLEAVQKAWGTSDMLMPCVTTHHTKLPNARLPCIKKLGYVQPPAIAGCHKHASQGMQRHLFKACHDWRCCNWQ